MNSADIQQILNTTNSEELKKALPYIGKVLQVREDRQLQDKSENEMITSFYLLVENLLAYSFFNSKNLDEARDKFVLSTQISVEKLMIQIPSNFRQQVFDALSKTLFQSDSSVAMYF